MINAAAKEELQLVGISVDLLSEISRDPAVYGDAAAALALGSLCFFADPHKVVGRSVTSVPDGNLVVLAIARHLARDQTSGIGKGPRGFAYAEEQVKPFLSRNQHLLVKAGQTFPVQTVLERARARVDQAAARVVGLQVPDLEPAPYKTLVGARRSDLEKFSKDPHDSSGIEAIPPPPKKAEPPAPPPPPPVKEPTRVKDNSEDFILGELDEALSTDGRVVYSGFIAANRTPVSLVELRSNWMLSESYMAELEPWVAKYKLIRNPHVLNVLGIYRPPGRLFIVYESLSGMTLERTIAHGPMEEKQVFSMMEAIATGLKAMHTAGLIHKGLRPDRVLVDASGTIRIFDPQPPRSTKPVGDEDTLRDKGLRGEVRYMSPELCTGQDAMTPSADVYSLGLIACEMMLGEQNLQRIAGESVRFWLNWHIDLYKKAIPLSEIDPDISPELSELVTKMLEKRVKNRYGDMGQLLHDIAAIRTGKKKAANRPPPRELSHLPQTGLAKQLASLFSGVGGQGGIPPRTLGLAGGVGFMFLLVILAALFKGGEDPIPHPTDDPHDPCKKFVEEALYHLRQEEFDLSSKSLDQMSGKDCGSMSTKGATSLRENIKHARELRNTVTDTLRMAKENEKAGKTVDAIGQYRLALSNFKQLSGLIQLPDRAPPDDLTQRLAALEPVRLMEESKEALKGGDAEGAKKLLNRLLDDYPNSTVAKDAEEFRRMVKDVIERKKFYTEAMNNAREADLGGRAMEAAQLLYQARSTFEEIERVSGRTNKPLPADLKDRLDQLYSKLWSIKTPTSDQQIVAEEMIVEISIPEKFFKEIILNGRRYPVKGDFMTLRLAGVKEGHQLLDITVISLDGNKSARKVPFRFNTPTEEEPHIQIHSISQSKGVTLAEITYKGEVYTIYEGWDAPDRHFKITRLDKRGIEITTSKKKVVFVPY